MQILIEMADYSLISFGRDKKGRVVYGSSVKLEENDSVKIGFDPVFGCDWGFSWFIRKYVSRKNSPLSREHCRVYIDDGKVYVMDLGSRTGTYLFNKLSRETREITNCAEINRDEVIGLIPSEKKKVPFRLEILVEKLSK